MHNQVNNNNGGFTLIESMVAISLLALAITGPMVIAQKGIASAVYARDQITAAYLAQEAIEYVRNIRDVNRITGGTWMSAFSSCKETGAGQRCRVDARYSNYMTPGAIQTCPSVSCPRLSFNEVDKLYGYGSGGSWRETQFVRTVAIDDRASSKETRVSVTVSWRTNLFAPTRSFTIHEHVFSY